MKMPMLGRRRGRNDEAVNVMELQKQSRKDSSSRFFLTRRQEGKRS